MLSRAIRRSLLEPATAALPPTFLLPFRAHLSTQPHSTSTTSTDPSTLSSPLHSGKNAASASSAKATARNNERLGPLADGSQGISVPRTTLPLPSSTPTQRSSTVDLHESIHSMLPLLRAQPPYYIQVQIHGKNYLLTAGDELRLPFLMPDVSPGDVLRLNRATHIGSRDFTLRAAASKKGTRVAPKVTRYLDERLFVCRATVMGVDSEPMRFLEKTKRRQRHVKTVKSKHRFTVLRIGEVTVKSVEDAERANAEEPLSGDSIFGMEEDVDDVQQTVVEMNQRNGRSAI
ncbi:hypothetical protein EJ05DRAFT_479680 [Pseudovirgaria hyperparasitica]|uniref:Large ribosomal subunit protein bL21m n=1 Tax=Pseudovirgaria hyperparasitica TaxID=470096 RepID=A0A6A6VU80_9PEZI|nr:uncharacterized protein EJ05DRAFT_479680 [Pseudovirgaria hyperparasitica]KAF2754132.1 hypothetical protein EJ05DRAFT_479680 [Pseudovirgaria hyperparasitica]